MDCKTRWNSLIKMLRRFYELRKEIKVAMAHLDRDFDFSEQELDMIKKLFGALAPIEMAVEYLCKQDANLLLSEKVIAFTLKKLKEQESQISKTLLERFEVRIQERRKPDVIHLLEYLKSPEYLDQCHDQFGIQIKRTNIAFLAISLLQRLYFGEESVANEDWEFEVVETLEVKNEAKKSITLSEEFQSFLEDSNNPAPPAQEEIGAHIVKKEMNLFEATKKRPENLDKLFKALLTIRPTSVEPERAFSAMGLFATKIRSSLNDDTLNALIFLREYYKKN